MKRNEILKSLHNEKAEAVEALKLSALAEGYDDRMYYISQYADIILDVERKAFEEYVEVPFQSKRDQYMSALVSAFIAEVDAEVEKK